jgi:outer membrane lipase/esterase
MSEQSVLGRGWRVGGAVAGVVFGVLPLAFPHWVSVVAEAYGNLQPDETVKLSSSAQSAGSALLTSCEGGENADGTLLNQRFQRDCGQIYRSVEDTEGRVEALSQLAAEQVGAAQEIAAIGLNGQLSLINHRLSYLRYISGIRAFSGDQEDSVARVPWPSGGAAGEDYELGQWGAFFNLKFSDADRDTTSGQLGYGADSREFTAGVDLRFSDTAVAGVMINYMDQDLDYHSGRGDLSIENWNLLLYGSRYWESGYFLDATLAFGTADYRLNRNIRYTVGGNSVSQVASSDPDGDLFLASLGGGFSFYQGAWNITPQLRLDYQESRMDGFQESMSSPGTPGGALALGFESTTYDSLTSNLGVQISRAFSYADGVLLPQASLFWVHEFRADEKTVEARYVNDINRLPVSVLTDGLDSDYFELQLGLSAQFTHGRSAYIAYNAYLGMDHLDYQSIDLGFRLEF